MIQTAIGRRMRPGGCKAKSDTPGQLAPEWSKTKKERCSLLTIFDECCELVAKMLQVEKFRPCMLSRSIRLTAGHCNVPMAGRSLWLDDERIVHHSVVVNPKMAAALEDRVLVRWAPAQSKWEKNR
ncbi:MAG: hypothetical protein OXD42_01650 [Rhodospirillaceae bacterium]|nr:hypothetical protein [Rhodospirillaceae bacterium]